MKTCTKCLTDLPLSEFYKGKKGRLRSVCRRCTNRENETRRSSNLDKYRAIERKSWRDNFDKNGPSKRAASRTWKLKSVYGLSLAEFEKMLIDQDNSCAICSAVLLASVRGRGRAFVACVDHDHKTGEVRGILCNSCNRGLGNFQDDPEALERAAAYLRKGAT